MTIIALARGVDYSVTGAAQMPPNAFHAESTFSSKFRISLLKVMVPLTGLEPVTPALRMRCSTN
jgi:hypothetical protein